MKDKVIIEAPPQDPVDVDRALRAQRLTKYTMIFVGLIAVLLVVAFTFDTPSWLRNVAAIAMLLGGLALMVSVMLIGSLRAERKRRQKLALAETSAEKTEKPEETEQNTLPD